ncbi:MAG: nuclear transport factor 2 family protein [Pyrinomonadaceae bacterium]|nr:nuclear transport factor 2 family protein [Pyrinomonadaceae bacterium]MBP6213208.1 nuclear transport factor 2 family protein [Pyrinomonadaceae bacterium]
MKSIPAFAILAMVMYVCGIGESTKQGGESPSNTASVPAKSSPTPEKKDDKETVLLELVKLEKDLTQAAFDGDITMLANNTTDDFELTGVDGKVQNKNQALADIKKETTIKSWKMEDIELVSHDEKTAVVRYIQVVTLKNGQSGKARVTDTFVKKDGKWLVKSEQATMLK